MAKKRTDVTPAPQNSDALIPLEGTASLDVEDSTVNLPEKILNVGAISLGAYYYDRFNAMIALNGGSKAGNVRSCIIQYVDKLWESKYLRLILPVTAALYGLSPDEWLRRFREGTLDQVQPVADLTTIGLPTSAFDAIATEAEKQGLGVEAYLAQLAGGFAGDQINMPITQETYDKLKRKAEASGKTVEEYLAVVSSL